MENTTNNTLENITLKIEFENRQEFLSKTYIIIYFIITGASSVIGVTGNTLTILTFLLTKGLHEIKNCFIINLAVADILVTGIVMPFSIFGAIAGKGYFDERKMLCRFLATVCAPGCLASMFTICWISCSRYFFICDYGRYLKIFTKRNTLLFVAVIWTACFMVHMPNHLGWGDSKYSTGFMICTLDMEEFSYSFFYGCNMVAAMGATFFFYFKIYQKVRGSNLAKKMITNKKVGATEQKGEIKKNREFQDEIKLAKTSFKIFVIFVCTWTPTAMLILIGISPLQFIPTSVYIYALFLAHSNSTLNFFIYYLDNEKFRQGINKMVKVTWKKVLRHTAINETTTSSITNVTLKTGSTANRVFNTTESMSSPAVQRTN